MSKANRNLHILIIPSWYPRFDGDIGGIFFREQAQALSKKGYKVGVIYPQFKSLKNKKLLIAKPWGLEKYNDDGVITYKYHKVNYTPRIFKIIKKRWIKTGIKLFEKYIEANGKPDLIHVHSLRYAGYVALYIKNKYNIPFVVTEHSTAYARNLISDEELNSLKEVVYASKFNIAVSKQFAELLNEIFGLKTWLYIPNIVNNQFINYQNSSTPKQFKYICVCFLNKKKSVDNLIHAFAKVNSIYPETCLYIGGDGPEKEKLLCLVKKLNIQHRVNFLGTLSRDEVKSEVANSSVFVLPSKHETFGVVLIEALALGKPVIATKCGGPESIVNEDVGILVDVNNIEQLSLAMLEMYSNYHTFNPNFIKQYCKDNYSESAITAKLSYLYNSTLKD